MGQGEGLGFLVSNGGDGIRDFHFFGFHLDWVLQSVDFGRVAAGRQELYICFRSFLFFFV